MSAVRPIFVALMLAAALLTSVPWSAHAQQTSQADADEAAELVERAQTTVSILQPLLDLEAALDQQIAEFVEKQNAGEEGLDEAELERLRLELEDARDQISVVVTGVSERDYRALDNSAFDLNSEVQNLLEPFVLVLNEATNDARQLERTRRALDVALRRLGNAELAIENINAALEEAANSPLATRFADELEIWQERRRVHQTQIEALNQQIQDLQSERGAVGRNMNSAFQVFFRDRGISLMLGFGAFLGTLGIARVLVWVAGRLMGLHGGSKTFAMRLGGVLFAVFSILAAYGVMLGIFNMRNDWLLLGLAIMLLLAGLWVALRMLPSLIEQLSVLLNLGAVQENERVLFNGVPFKVERLSFFTDLVNPALDGGEFTLPVRELVGMHSRPAAEDESWFPSLKGDWVRLADGNAGQVIAQTPEMVVVELLGGARITYQTPDYLSALPENLSLGFRTEVEFGIDYAHQAQATTTIIDIMRQGVIDHFTTLLDPHEIRAIDVEFLRAGASSLDYEVEIDTIGAVAHRFEELERELARCLVNLANAHGWGIPFQQMVIHQAKA